MKNRHKAIMLDKKALDYCKLKAPPAAKSYWRGMEHGQLLQEVVDAGHKLRLGWEFSNWEMVTSIDQSAMVAVLTVHIPGLDPPSGWAFAITLANSNRRDVAVKMMGGLRNADHAIMFHEWGAGKHTQKLTSVPWSDYLWAFYENARYYHEEPTRELGWYPTVRDTMEILVSAGKIRIMPWSRVGRLLDKNKGTTQKTAWQLLLQFADMAKMNPAMKRIHQIHKFYLLLKAAKRRMT